VQHPGTAHTRPVVAVHGAAEILDAAQGYLWILLAALVVWRLFPVLHKRLESDDITVESGGKKVSLQSASSQVQAALDDLRSQVIALRERVDGSTDMVADDGAATSEAGPPTLEAVPARRVRILWVDDEPENNAFLINSLRDRADVDEATSTDKALAELTSDPRGFDVVISDMVRDEPRGFRPDAGIDLVRRMREAKLSLPVVIYASRRAVASSGTEALEAGAAAVTASPTELLTILRIGPTTAFEAEVADIVRRHLGATPFPIRRTVDFVAERSGERIAVEIKNWPQQPARREFERTLESVAAARERYGFAQVLLITRPGIAVPADIDLPPWMTVLTIDELVPALTSQPQS
jgi:CheY-like chemotaxis protein